MPDHHITISIPEGDPVVSIWRWRHDSQTLARLRPVLERLSLIPNQPCRIYDGQPYRCLEQDGKTMCIPCAIRDIKQALFGGATDGPTLATTTDGPGRADAGPADERAGGQGGGPVDRPATAEGVAAE